jgi:predicted enzyme related to lactoylglutathione lyase
VSSNANYFLNNRPAWVDLSSPDPEASRNFYSQLLGWDIQVNPDPQYGGYSMATDAGVGVAGIGPKMDPNAPTAWALYIGTDDAAALAQRVTDNGGKVVAAPFDVGDQGKMAVFQDPSGAFFSTWQASGMRGFVSHQPGAFDWGELNARNVENVLPFYEKVFGWAERTMQGGDSGDSSQPPYHEFTLEGESILGAWEMNPMVPAAVPNYWQVYFGVEDVDFVSSVAERLGAKTMVAPQAMPGGKFSILTDPQGASFGLLHFEAPEGE